MVKIRIVPLTRWSAAGVARLWRRCFPAESLHAHPAWHPWLGPMTAARIERRILARKAFDPAGSFVVLSKGRVIGFAQAAFPPDGPADRSARTPGSGYLCALAVDPRFRRQGIGSLLLARAERYLARGGARSVLTGFEGNPIALLGGVPMNDQAYPFFLNRGFRSVEQGQLQVMTQDTTRA